MEVDVEFLRKLWNDLFGLIKAGVDDACEFGTDIAQQCATFALDVGGVMLEDIKSAAKSLGIDVQWKIPSIANFVALIDEMIEKLLQSRNVTT